METTDIAKGAEINENTNGIDSMKRNLAAMSSALQGITVSGSEQNVLENAEAINETGIAADSPPSIIPMDIGDVSFEAIQQNVDVIPEGSSTYPFLHMLPMNFYKSYILTEPIVKHFVQRNRCCKRQNFTNNCS